MEWLYYNKIVPEKRLTFENRNLFDIHKYIVH